MVKLTLQTDIALKLGGEVIPIPKTVGRSVGSMVVGRSLGRSVDWTC